MLMELASTPTITTNIRILRKVQVVREVTYREDTLYGKIYGHWNEKTTIFVRILFVTSSEKI